MLSTKSKAIKKTPEEVGKLKETLFVIYKQIARLLVNNIDELNHIIKAVCEANNQSQKPLSSNNQTAFALVGVAIYLQELLAEQSIKLDKKGFLELQENHYLAVQLQELKKYRLYEPKDDQIERNIKLWEEDPRNTYDAMAKERKAELMLFGVVQNSKKQLVNLLGDRESLANRLVASHNLPKLSDYEVPELDILSIKSYLSCEYQLNFVSDSHKLMEAFKTTAASLPAQQRLEFDAERLKLCKRTIEVIKSLEDKKLKLRKNQLALFDDMNVSEMSASLNKEKEDILARNLIFARDLKELLKSRQSFFNTKSNNKLIKDNSEKIGTTISISDTKSIIQDILDNYQPKNNLLHQCAHFIFKLRNGREFTREDTDTYKKVQEFSMRYGLAASAA